MADLCEGGNETAGSLKAGKPRKKPQQITCPDRKSNPGHLVSQPDALAVTPQGEQNPTYWVSHTQNRILHHNRQTTRDAVVIGQVTGSCEIGLETEETYEFWGEVTFAKQKLMLLIHSCHIIGTYQMVSSFQVGRSCHELNLELRGPPIDPDALKKAVEAVIAPPGNKISIRAAFSGL
ncbi:hypothetical protein ANN_20823 [Periplaneta americana]|uniref:Per a allergen n=1 Tax=Periplaneta americana TaxID=6978 RepID=A0ABQ8SDP8_PERAM|nr:hypothetical protein ANN_20823 [Periplaneta americana]